MSNVSSNLLGNSSLRAVAVRLLPGHDVRERLQEVCRAQDIDAAVVLGAVGSLESAQIRLANQPQPTLFDRKLEILSLSGTASHHGVHLHVMASDDQGSCIGGHVSRGCRVYTTLELVLGVLNDLTFTREHDPATGFAELQIKPNETGE